LNAVVAEDTGYDLRPREPGIAGGSQHSGDHVAGGRQPLGPVGVDLSDHILYDSSSRAGALLHLLKMFQYPRERYAEL
jgi:hypothetical protein